MGFKHLIKKYYNSFSLRKKVGNINERSDFFEKKILELLEENDRRKLETEKLLKESNDLKYQSMQLFHEYYGLIDSNTKSIASLLRTLILKYYGEKNLIVRKRR